MPRRRRDATAGLVFHVVNRGAKRSPLFESAGDYEAFEKVLVRGIGRISVDVFAYCLMPNHWHFVMSPRLDGALSRFMHWVTTTHARRWHIARGLDGQGAVYQGRFKAIPIGTDQYFLWVCRYVERNALRASLVGRAEQWRWSSLWRRAASADASWLADWPVSRPADWIDQVNRPQTPAELRIFRKAVTSGEPFGDETWRVQVKLRLGHKLPSRPPGRPRFSAVLEK